MSGWRWHRNAKKIALTPLTSAQAKVARSVPLVAQADRLYTQSSTIVSPYGPAYPWGRPAYAEPPSASVMQTVFAVIGQLNLAQKVGPWVYSPGLPTSTTSFPQLGGNPPEGGFVLDNQIGSL